MICGRTCDGLYHLAFYLVNFGIPQVSPSQTHRCPGACSSRQNGHVMIFNQSQGALCVSPWLSREPSCSLEEMLGVMTDVHGLIDRLRY